MSRSFFPRFVRQTAIAITACLASLTFAVSSAHAQGLFSPPSSTQLTGTNPQGVAAADFARSGYQSLVVANYKSKNITVYLATGPATFAAGYTYTACNAPNVVLAQDVNRDGYPDIVVGCSTKNLVDVFINDGTGHFGGTVYTYSASDPVAMALGDFNGDGNLDLAVAGGSGTITVLLDIAGAETSNTIAASGTLTGIVTGDFNHDGHLDLAISGKSKNNVQVFQGDGTGNFSSAGSYSAGTGPTGIATADFNQDGNLDLGVTNGGSNNVSILLGSASGTFTTQPYPQSAGTDPIAIALTDVNSDGYVDVVAFDAQNTGSTTQGAVSVLLGNGDGTLQPPQTANLIDVPGTQPVVADFNRDGKPDLAITLTTANQVTLLLNNTLPTPYPGGRSFAGARTITAGNGNMADSITTGDFNGDGLLDTAVSYLEDNDVAVLLNNGGGGFNLSAKYAVGQQPYFVTSGDLNGDGYSDLVAVNSSINTSTGTVSILLNNGKSGKGTFAAAVSYNVGRLPYQAAIGDLNGDGYPDLAVTNYGANTVSILYGSKSGAFTTGPTLITGSEPYGVAIGDFEHNGHPGVAVTCFGLDMLYVFPNNGNGTFGSPYIYSTGSGPMTLVTGDFNRDGKLDIVVANATGGPAGDTNPVTSGNNISFFAGNGNGTFQAGVIGPSLNFPDSIAAGDVNGDGILDIVGVAPNFNAVEVTLGVGDGTFGTIQQRAQGEFTVPKQPWAVALGDFNNDGQLDIVTANTYNQVNITIPAYQQRYMTQYPPVTGGNPSVDLLLNGSAAAIGLSIAPPNNTLPLSDNNSNVVIQASVQPALSGNTPTGSVIFENSAGAPLGTGPYPLTSGVASYNVGHLGSGQYQFTSLYSGDTNYQPTTASGASFAVTVAGTPVTLTISPGSVPYGNTFIASVTVTGTAALGTPTGTVAIYSSTGFELGTVTIAKSGNNSAGTATFTAIAPHLNVGTYEFYAAYTPTNGNYQAGTSSYAPLTVTVASTATAVNCTYGFLSINCTATVTNTSTTPASAVAGIAVDFTVNGGGATPVVTNAAGQANYTLGEFFGSFTVKATVATGGNYVGSSANTTVLCFILCGLDRPNPSVPFTAFSGVGFNDNSSAPAALRAGELNRPVPLRLF